MKKSASNSSSLAAEGLEEIGDLEVISKSFTSQSLVQALLKCLNETSTIMDILIRIIYFRYFDLIGSACRNEKKNKTIQYDYVKIMATEKLVDLEVILSISFEKEYLEGLEGFKLSFFV